MPTYVAQLSSCDCTPIPDMVFRADDMVSAVMTCQEKLDAINRKAEEKKIALHEDLSILSLSEADFELFDDEGVENVVSFWTATVEK